jgi:hypothetical protein
MTKSDLLAAIQKERDPNRLFSYTKHRDSEIMTAAANRVFDLTHGGIQKK